MPSQHLDRLRDQFWFFLNPQRYTLRKAQADAIMWEQVANEYREALERVVVCCDNGSEPINKLAFVRRVAAGALTGARS